MQVEFHKGFFRYSLPTWRAQDSRPIAVLRMDGDMYESTMVRGPPYCCGKDKAARTASSGGLLNTSFCARVQDQIYNLYNSVSAARYVIIHDDAIPQCKTAVHEFLDRHGIRVDILFIDPANKGSSGAYFRKPKGAPVDVSWYLAFNQSRTADDLVVMPAST